MIFLERKNQILGAIFWSCRIILHICQYPSSLSKFWLFNGYLKKVLHDNSVLCLVSKATKFNVDQNQWIPLGEKYN